MSASNYVNSHGSQPINPSMTSKQGWQYSLSQLLFSQSFCQSVSHVRQSDMAISLLDGELVETVSQSVVTH